MSFVRRLHRVKATSPRFLTGSVVGLASLTLLYILAFSQTDRPLSIFGSSKQWRGWDNVDYVFFFGDSWTSNGFDIAQAQPDMHNPIGNPDFPGECSSNGPNWVAFLTATYNQSFIRSYDIAHGASTVDRTIIPPLFRQTFTLREQVEDLFPPVYASKTSPALWKPYNTLFAVWSGIVDLELFVRNGNSTDLVPSVIASYNVAIDKLYENGARNFLLLNVPPLNRAPGNEDPVLAASFIELYNRQLLIMKDEFVEAHPDATAMVFDSSHLFAKLLEDPSGYPQITDLVTNYTSWCQGYNDLLGPTTPEIDTFYEECGVPVNQFFWLNSLHPGYAVHNATAYAITEHCLRQKGEFCL